MLTPKRPAGVYFFDKELARLDEHIAWLERQMQALKRKNARSDHWDSYNSSQFYEIDAAIARAITIRNRMLDDLRNANGISYSTHR